MSRGIAGAPLALNLAAFAAFTSANLIHNELSLDPAIAPPAVFIALFLWKRRTSLLLVAACLIAFPAFAFLRLSELSSPASALSFLNHLALLAAGLLGVAGVIAALLGRSHAAARA
jgi:hypothetical protein